MAGNAEEEAVLSRDSEHPGQAFLETLSCLYSVAGIGSRPVIRRLTRAAAMGSPTTNFRNLLDYKGCALLDQRRLFT